MNKTRRNKIRKSRTHRRKTHKGGTFGEGSSENIYGSKLSKCIIEIRVYCLKYLKEYSKGVTNNQPKAELIHNKKRYKHFSNRITKYMEVALEKLDLRYNQVQKLVPVVPPKEILDKQKILNNMINQIVEEYRLSLGARGTDVVLTTLIGNIIKRLQACGYNYTGHEKLDSLKNEYVQNIKSRYPYIGSHDYLYEENENEHENETKNEN